MPSVTSPLAFAAEIPDRRSTRSRCAERQRKAIPRVKVTLPLAPATTEVAKVMSGPSVSCQRRAPLGRMTKRSVKVTLGGVSREVDQISAIPPS